MSGLHKITLQIRQEEETGGEYEHVDAHVENLRADREPSKRRIDDQKFGQQHLRHSQQSSVRQKEHEGRIHPQNTALVSDHPNHDQEFEQTLQQVERQKYTQRETDCFEIVHERNVWIHGCILLGQNALFGDRRFSGRGREVLSEEIDRLS